MRTRRMLDSSIPPPMLRDSSLLGGSRTVAGLERGDHMT